MQGREDPSTGRPPSQQDSSRRTLPLPPSSDMLATSRISALPSPPNPDRPSPYSSDPGRYGRTFTPASPEHRLPPLMGSMERLPSVSQLLTPSSQAPPLGGPSLFFDRNASHDRRFELPSPLPRTPADAHARPSTGYFPQETWRDTDGDPRPRPPPQTLAPASDPTSRPYAPPSAGAPSPLQLPDNSVQSQAPPPLAVRTPTTWHASQSPQSAVSTLPPNTGSGTPIAKTSEKTVAARRLLGERNIPGEGRVYVYDDGTKIPTVVDGERVNGQWGMTKAGKPRKRMPQACIACRQKKIKCDPAEGKCAQCEKSGKDCKYTEGHRGHKSTASSPSQQAGTGTPNSERPTSSPQFVPNGLAGKKRSASVDFARGKHKRIASADSAPTLRRVRLDHNWTASISENDRGRLLPVRWAGHPRGRHSCADFWAPGLAADGMSLDDPFLSEPDRAGYYLERYFERINNGIYMLFPRRTIEAWAHSGRMKSRGEVTTLYAMLANGCLFSDREEAKQDTERYVRAARYGIDTAPGMPTFLLVVSSFVLGHYYFTLGDFSNVLEINDLSRAVSTLPQELEDRLTRPDADDCYDFGMNRHQIGELSRRTQWIAFVVDRFIGITMHFPLCFNKKDQFVRLPCDNEVYDRGEPMLTPYFDNGVLGRKYIESQAGGTPLSIWSFFIQAMSFDGDIRGEAHRSEWIDDDLYPGNYDSFAKRTARELDVWYQHLPSAIQFTEANIDHHLHTNTLGLFFAIHTIYHTCHINMNRRVRANLLPRTSLSYNARATYWHARTVVEKADGIRRRIEAETTRLGHEPTYQPSPYLSYTMLSAMDVLTCCGLAEGPGTTHTLDLVEQGLEAMSRVAVWYATSRGQMKKIENRVAEIKVVVESAKQENGPTAWVCVHPLQPYDPAYMDIFYQEQGGVRNIILAEREIKPDDMRVEYLQKEKVFGLIDPVLKTVWGDT